MFIRLFFNYHGQGYRIPQETDSQVCKLTDDHPAVNKMIAMVPPYNLIGMENYTGIIYALRNRDDPYGVPRLNRNTGYWIKV